MQLAASSAAVSAAAGQTIDPVAIAENAMRQSHQQHQQYQQQRQQQRIDPDKLLDLLVLGRRVVTPTLASLPPLIETPMPPPTPPVRKSFGVLGLERRGGLVGAGEVKYTGDKVLKSGNGGGKGVGAAAAMEEAGIAVRLGLMMPKQQQQQQQQQQHRTVVPLSFVSRGFAMKAAAAGV